jgi:hypothetical protein
MKVISREKVFERLDQLLQVLRCCCCDDVEFFWPPGWLLGQIDECVMFLIELERKKRPCVGWKAFKTLDKRRRSLRLVPRINSLVKRAIERRKEKCSESVLEKAARRPDSLGTQILLRDFSAEEFYGCARWTPAKSEKYRRRKAELPSKHFELLLTRQAYALIVTYNFIPFQYTRNLPRKTPRYSTLSLAGNERAIQRNV